MNWSLVTTLRKDANEAILKSCLGGSACVRNACDFNVMRGYSTAGAAYNEAMRKARGDILVFAHQDVYLPDCWDEHLATAIDRLTVEDPNWGVLGVWGITNEQKPSGYSYCTGLKKVLGIPFEKPVECGSFDEAVLVVRRSSGLAFDEQLPRFHLYGTDIVLAAKERGLKSYVVSAFCIHNTAGIKWLASEFWRAYFYMRRKWWNRLPVKTPCTVIEKWTMPYIDDRLRGFYAYHLKGRKVGDRVADPAALYQELVRSNRVQLTTTTTASGKDSADTDHMQAYLLKGKTTV